MTARTAGWALTWEYWRRGTFWLVASIVGLVTGSTALLYGSLLGITGLRYGDLRAELDAGLIALVLVPPLVLVTACFAASRRQYALPVATPLLVVSTLANGALATVCVYCSVALMLGGLFHTAWPLLLPASWSATVYVSLQSLVWQAGRSRGLFVLLVMLFLMSAIPLGVDYLLPHLLPAADQPARAGFSILGELFLVLAPTWVLAYLLSVNGVARDRRGDSWSLGWLVRGWSWLMDLTAGVSGDVHARTFRSPYAAQCWFEWRTKGRVVFLCMLAVLGGLWIWLSVGQRQPEDVDAAIEGLSGLFLVLIPFVGLYLGSDAGRFDRQTFAATRPLSDGALASAVLRNVAVVVGRCGAVWLLGILAALLAFRASASDWQQFQAAWASGPRLFVSQIAGPTAQLLVTATCFLLGAWTAVALGAALALARSWFVAVGGCLCVALLVSLLWSWNSGGRHMFAAMCLLGTCMAFLAAYRLRVISSRMILRCCAVYVLLCITSISIYAVMHAEDRPLAFVLFILVGLCAAPFAPLAAAPCALSWNRHR